MEEHIDVDEFMAYVRGQGFEIQDNLFTHGIRTFVISGGGLPDSYDVNFDITREVWNKCSMEDLIQQINSLKHMIDENSKELK